jgi:hypothetical protein
MSDKEQASVLLQKQIAAAQNYSTKEEGQRAMRGPILFSSKRKLQQHKTATQRKEGR